MLNHDSLPRESGYYSGPLISFVDWEASKPYFFDGRFANLADIQVPTNDTCEGLVPDPGRTVIPPLSFGGVGISENSIHGEPRLVADDRIVKGEKFYVVRGCAAYSTQEKVRNSSFVTFCILRIPTQTPEQKAVQPPQQPTRVFQLQSCAAGFDAT